MLKNVLFEKYEFDTKKWFPSLIFCFYYLTTFLPPRIIPFDLNRWYILLFFSTLVYIQGNYRLSKQSIKFLSLIFSLHIFGAFIALPNSYDIYKSFIGFLGLGIMFIQHLFFLPLTTSPFLRKIFLVGLIVSALIWAYEIALIKGSVVFMTYTTFGNLTGANKNFVSFLMAISTIACIHLAFSINSKIVVNTFRLLILRSTLIIFSIVIFFHQALIYSRSTLITTIVGILAVLYTFLKKSGYNIINMKFISIIFFIYLSISYLFQTIITTSPQILNMYDKIQNSESSELFVGRKFLLNKAVYLLSKNPIIGIGVGGSKAKTAEGDYANESAHIHNAYLTEWIDKGLVGLFAYLLWIFVFFKFLFQFFNRLQIIDQVWLIIIGMTFFHLNFKDMTAFAFLMLLIFCGLKNNYEQIKYYQKKILKNNLNY